MLLLLHVFLYCNLAFFLHLQYVAGCWINTRTCICIVHSMFLWFVKSSVVSIVCMVHFKTMQLVAAPADNDSDVSPSVLYLLSLFWISFIFIFWLISKMFKFYDVFNCFYTVTWQLRFLSQLQWGVELILFIFVLQLLLWFSYEYIFV